MSYEFDESTESIMCYGLLLIRWKWSFSYAETLIKVVIGK